MMTNSVKIGEKAKSLLDKAQARVTLSTGRKVSQQELLEAMIKFSANREDQFISEELEPSRPLTDRGAEALLEIPVDWVVETREEDIDAYLYDKRVPEEP